MFLIYMGCENADIDMDQARCSRVHWPAGRLGQKNNNEVGFTKIWAEHVEETLPCFWGSSQILCSPHLLLVHASWAVELP